MNERILRNINSMKLAKQLLDLAFEDLKNEPAFREHFDLARRTELLDELEIIIQTTWVIAKQGGEILK